MNAFIVYCPNWKKTITVDSVPYEILRYNKDTWAHIIDMVYPEYLKYVKRKVDFTKLRCCNCGNEDITIEWCGESSPFFVAGEVVTSTKKEFHRMIIQCNRCKYYWKEKPLDSE